MRLSTITVPPAGGSIQQFESVVTIFRNVINHTSQMSKYLDKVWIRIHLCHLYFIMKTEETIYWFLQYSTISRNQHCVFYIKMVVITQKLEDIGDILKSRNIIHVNKKLYSVNHSIGENRLQDITKN